MDDPYAILGIPVTATLAEAKTAYHALLRTIHPDKGVCPLTETRTVDDLKRSYETIIARLRATVIVRVPPHLFRHGGLVAVWYMQTTDAGFSAVTENIYLPAAPEVNCKMRHVRTNNVDVHVYLAR